MDVTDHIVDDHEQHTFTGAYENFSLIHKEFISVLNNMLAEFPQHKDYYVKLRQEIGFLVTFCRGSLMWIFNENGDVNQGLIGLVGEIEGQLVNLVQDFTNQLSCGESNNCDWYLFSDAVTEMNIWGVIVQVNMFDEKIEMKKRIVAAYDEYSFICFELTNYHVIKELLDQLIEDLDCINQDEYKSIKQKFIDLANYIAFVAKCRIFDDNLVNLLVDVQVLARQVACYSFMEKICKDMCDYNVKDMHSRFSMQVFNILALKLDGPGGALRMTDELLVAYVKYVQEMISELQEDVAHINLKIQLKVLDEELSFLTHLVIRYPPKQAAKKKRVLDARLHLQNLARAVGFFICSWLNNHDKVNMETHEEEMSDGICDLIEKSYGVKEKIIITIRCLILEKAWRESPKSDRLGFFILLLKNMKKLTNQKQDSGMTWNEHENLVLFIFYLQNGVEHGSRNIDQVLDYCKQEKQVEILTKKLNNFRMDVDWIKHGEVRELLVSCQVVAFKMSCSSLLVKYGKLHWWELYLVTKEQVTTHMRVGILTAVILSSTTTLSDELLTAYVECVQDSLIELQRDVVFALLKDKSKILNEGLLFLWRFLTSYKDDEHEKLSHIKVSFQDWARNVGSAICCIFNNRKGVTVTKHGIELSDLAEKLNVIKVETKEFIHLVNLNKIAHESPKTDRLGSLNLLLENWKGLMDCETDLIVSWKDQLQMIHGNLVLLKTFITKNVNGGNETQNLCNQIMAAGYVAEYLLTSFSVGNCYVGCTSLWISEFMKNVELMKASAMEVREKKGNVKEINSAKEDPSQVSSQDLLARTVTDVVVGFEAEMELIRKRLHGHLKQLDVISITGMPGLGKTSLARRVYEDPYTVRYFDARAWCCISQEYNKKELILTILDAITALTDEIRGKNEAELSVMVHKELMGRRYFIVVDDVWEINAFMGLKTFFPDDNNGSRIMLTSRSKQIGVEANGKSDPIEPSMLSDEESWVLLERKVYNKGKCPSHLCQIGKEIAQKCKGLPLAVVVVGGVLAKSTQKRDLWEQVARDLSSHLAHDPQSQVMASLELSYKFLPDYLRPMFLYLGAFPEDMEINVDNLIWLWIAEGFVQKKKESTVLEIQAEIYLMELIDRSLLTVARRRSDGRVKACHVHDLLRDMCLAKAKEEKFMQQIHANNELPDPIMYQRRLSIFFNDNTETFSRHFVAHQDLPMLSITPPICSLLYFREQVSWPEEWDIKSLFSDLKLLKVLQADVIFINSEKIFDDLMTTVHLRYLSISSSLKYIPSSISRLRSLEILIIEAHDTRIPIPETIWEMTKLRHVQINEGAEFSVAPENPFILYNLETLSTVVICFGEEEKHFRKVPGLKTLKSKFYRGNNHVLNFESLDKLESLKVSRYFRFFCKGIKLPLTLKRLSISDLSLEWSDILMFQELKNLEVLKLNEHAVHDEFWDMGDDDEFTNLKFLKLKWLNIKRWTASSVNFPRLEEVVLEHCWHLEEIPSSLGEFETLQKIEVKRCNKDAAKIAMEIRKEQEEFGNELLKVHITD